MTNPEYGQVKLEAAEYKPFSRWNAPTHPEASPEPKLRYLLIKGVATKRSPSDGS